MDTVWSALLTWGYAHVELAVEAERGGEHGLEQPRVRVARCGLD